MSDTPTAGANLDAMVAEEVMGYPHLALGQMEPVVGYMDFGSHIEVRSDITTPGYYGLRSFAPSTDIAAAWQIVDKMRANGHTFGVDCIGEEHDDRPWMAWFFAPFDARDCDDRRYTEWAATAPLAICLAALAASGRALPGGGEPAP